MQDDGNFARSYDLARPGVAPPVLTTTPFGVTVTPSTHAVGETKHGQQMFELSLFVYIDDVDIACANVDQVTSL
jgi:hypothetical protein